MYLQTIRLVAFGKSYIKEISARVFLRLRARLWKILGGFIRVEQKLKNDRGSVIMLTVQIYKVSGAKTETELLRNGYLLNLKLFLFSVNFLKIPGTV